MTQAERLLALLKEMGFEPEEVTRHPDGSIYKADYMSGQGNVTGYSYFYVTFCFDSDGKATEMSVWE